MDKSTIIKWTLILFYVFIGGFLWDYGYEHFVLGFLMAAVLDLNSRAI